ncbi:MAG: DEAD/DEAH box helicase [Prevotella sp.]|nr:DEAD/DEAH box helicase [Prevotella sp.]
MLRDYQLEMLEQLHEAWKIHQSVMIQMPTGTGKTHLMAQVISKHATEHVLIVAHRIELIEQISQTLTRFGVAHGMIHAKASMGTLKKEEHVMVASIQTLSRRMEQVSFVPDLIIVDEAHHALAKTYRMLWNKWEKAKFLGLTATPCRLNRTGFTDLFDLLLRSWDIQQFIEKGWLSDFEYISIGPENEMVGKVLGLQKRGVDGDYQTKEMATVMDTPDSIEHLFRSYEQYAWGKKGIVYAINREHAQHIADYYSQHHVHCCWIEARTPAEERQRLVEAYRKGDINVIVNVDIFSEGFDCPEVEFIQLARPTLSLSKYLQQVGRGMRVTKGKSYVAILDQVGLYQTFGLPTDERPWEQMFLGRTAGKGVRGEERGFIIRDDAKDKQLVNLEMVRIKRRGEPSTGVEVFMKDGRYGVLKDGQVCCPAEFEHVERLAAPYFVMGFYPYYIYKSKVTVIDEHGHDLRAGLYGKVRQDGDIFIGQDVQGHTVYWDAKGGRSYQMMPHFERIRRFEVARTGEQLQMRQSMKGWEASFAMSSVYLNDYFTIMGNILIYQNDIRKSYKIRGYEPGFIYLENGELPGYRYAVVNRFGHIFQHTNSLPQRLASHPDVTRLGLKRYF